MSGVRWFNDAKRELSILELLKWTGSCCNANTWVGLNLNDMLVWSKFIDMPVALIKSVPSTTPCNRWGITQNKCFHEKALYLIFNIMEDLMGICSLFAMIQDWSIDFSCNLGLALTKTWSKSSLTKDWNDPVSKRAEVCVCSINIGIVGFVELQNDKCWSDSWVSATGRSIELQKIRFPTALSIYGNNVPKCDLLYHSKYMRNDHGRGYSMTAHWCEVA